VNDEELKELPQTLLNQNILFIICYAEIARRNEPASRISKK
jgi:hypothetical protein